MNNNLFFLLPFFLKREGGGERVRDWGYRKERDMGIVVFPKTYMRCCCFS
jgi:hypothetical protein